MFKNSAGCFARYLPAFSCKNIDWRLKAAAGLLAPGFISLQSP
jgi:hypothetical protein